MAASVESRHLGTTDQVELLRRCRAYSGDSNALIEIPLRSGSWCVSPESEEISLAELIEECSPTQPDENPHVVTGLVFHREDVDEFNWAHLSLSAAGIGVLDGTRRAFTGDTTPTALKSLRTWAASQLELRGCRSNEAILALSEMATNVERYAPGWLMVDLVFYRGAALLSVTDRFPLVLPSPSKSSVDDVSGRGLWIVASLSIAWGVVCRSVSKSVWALIECEFDDGEDRGESRAGGKTESVGKV
ncbi:MAG TPA: ATP-binding protein [Microthrixaceae bacterium]|nr:ATP-binding protein [Microthrixaceae bacterium]